MMQPNPPPQGQQNSSDNVTWWFKFLTRGVGTVGGLVAMITGLVTAISFSAICIVAGVLQILIGFIAVLFEAPCCCQFIEFADKVGKFSETRPAYQKALGYTILPLIPVIMCFGMSTIFGCALVFVCGVLYGLTVLGKKADRDAMMSSARGEDLEMKANLIAEEERVDLHVPESK